MTEQTKEYKKALKVVIDFMIKSNGIFSVNNLMNLYLQGEQDGLQIARDIYNDTSKGGGK